MAAFGLDPTIAMAIGGILGILGLALALWGRSIWKAVMTLIGAALGSIAGFLIGISFFGTLIALVLSLVGAVIGSILFGKLVNIALAFVTGLLAAAIVFFAVPGLGDTRVIAAVIALFAVFALAYYFIEELLGIITAIIGGILVGLGIYIAIGPGTEAMAALAGFGLFAVGAILQTMKIRRQKAVAAAMARPPAAPVAPPPPPPPR